MPRRLATLAAQLAALALLCVCTRADTGVSVGTPLESLSRFAQVSRTDLTDL